MANPFIGLVTRTPAVPSVPSNPFLGLVKRIPTPGTARSPVGLPQERIEEVYGPLPEKSGLAAILGGVWPYMKEQAAGAAEMGAMAMAAQVPGGVGPVMLEATQRFTPLGKKREEIGREWEQHVEAYPAAAWGSRLLGEAGVEALSGGAVGLGGALMRRGVRALEKTVTREALEAAAKRIRGLQPAERRVNEAAREQVEELTHGVALSKLSDDEMADLLARIETAPEIDEAAVRAIERESAKRQVGHHALPPEEPPVPPAGPPMAPRGGGGVDPVPPPKASWLERMFTSRGKFAPVGELKKRFHKLTVEAEGGQKAEAWRMERSWDAVEREAKKHAVPRETMLAYLQGQAVDLPPSLATRIDALREQMDRLSQMAQETPGLLSESMATIYGKNIGEHLTRGYEAFINPNYLDRVRDTAVWDESLDFLRQEPWTQGWADREIEGWMEEFVRRGPQMFQAGKVEGIPGRMGALAAHRKNIPDVLQRLLGRIDDPEFRFKKTVERLAPDIYRQRALNEMVELGRGTIFFDRATKGFSTPIPGAGTKSPVGDLYTTPEIADMFSGLSKMEGKEPGLTAWFVDKYLAGNAMVKGGFTAYSPPQHARNTTSWGLTSIATGQGLAPVRNARRAIRSLRETFSPEEAAKAVGAESAEEFSSLWETGLRRGVIGQSVIGGHLGEYSRWVGQPELTPATALGKAKAAVQGGFQRFVSKPARKLYGLEDDLPKMAIWIDFMKDYRRALPDLSDAELIDLTADIIRDITPTWDMVPRGVREVSKFPAVGMFPGFNEEMVRNTKNIVKLAVTELRSGNPKLRQLGRRRLRGLTLSLLIPETVAGAATRVAGAGGAVAGGISLKQYMERREFQPPWSENATMLYLPPPEGEDIRQVDLGFTDPRGALKKPIFAAIATALAEDAGTLQKISAPVLELARTLLGPEAAFTAVSEAVTGQKTEGGRVRNPAEPALEQGLDTAAHLGRALSPGIARQTQNIYRAHSGWRSTTGYQRKPWQEWLATLGGVRVSDRNLAQAAPYDAWEVGDHLQNSRAIFRERIYDTLRADKPLTRETIRAALDDSMEAWRPAWKKLRRQFEAYKTEGRAREFIEALDTEGGMPQEYLVALIQGAKEPPTIVSVEMLENILERHARLRSYGE